MTRMEEKSIRALIRWRREEVVAKQQSIAQPRGEGKKGKNVCGRCSREPPTIRKTSISFQRTTKKHTRNGCVFVGAEKRILAFSGAPRWTIINCPVCCHSPMKFCRVRQTVLHLQNASPLESSSKLGRQQKRDMPTGISLFCGAEKRIRTSGTFQAHTRFPIVLLKPLRHLCINRPLQRTPIYITVFFQKRQAFFMRFSKNLLKS